jgi:hypothetical protein
MSRPSWNLVGLLVPAPLVSGVGNVAAGDQAPNLSGIVTVTATSVAAGIGWSWDSGTLTLLDGSQHPFKVCGLDVVAVGIKQATGVGDVYHSKNGPDFEGKCVLGAGGRHPLCRNGPFDNGLKAAPACATERISMKRRNQWT